MNNLLLAPPIDVEPIRFPRSLIESPRSLILESNPSSVIFAVTEERSAREFVTVSETSETVSENENLSGNELKHRLCRSGNNLQIFESDFYADRALSDDDILENVYVLKISKFRGVFIIDELPKTINPVE